MRDSTNVYFLAAFALTVAVLYALFPWLTWRAEVNYEVGTNLFATAYHENLWTNLWAKDAGYLPWLPRLVAVVLVKGFGVVRYYPHAAQAAAVFNIAFCAACINLRMFRSFIEHDVARFAVSLPFGLFLLADTNMLPLHNSTHYCSVFLLLMLVVKIERLSWLACLGWATYGGLSFLSKGSFVVLLPVYAAFLGRALWTKDRKGIVFFALTTSAALLQAYTLFHSQQGYNDMTGSPGLAFVRAHPADFLRRLGFYVVNSYPVYLLQRTDFRSQSVAAGLVLLLAGLFALEIARRQQSRSAAFLGVCAFTALSSYALLVVARPLLKSLDDGTWVPFTARNFLASAAIHLACVTLLVRLIPNRLPQLASLGLLALTILAGRQAPLIDVDEIRPKEVESQWKIYHKLLAYDDYVIPVNYEHWYIGRHNVECARKPLHRSPELDLRAEWPWSETWAIRAVVFEVPPEERQYLDGLVLAAVDESGEVAATARRLTPATHRYQYYLFEQRTPARCLRIMALDGTPATITCRELRVYGKP